MNAHTPALLTTVLNVLAVRPGATILDATVGLGGHAAALLSAAEPGDLLVGLDADAENLALAHARLKCFGERAVLIHANFRALPDCLPPPLRSFDAILADLGVSSPHLDDPARGFTFRSTAPLDLRYDRSEGSSGADILTSASERELMMTFATLGQLPRPRSLARAIAEERRQRPLLQSCDLVSVAERVYRWQTKRYLPQIFQALRMRVNDELLALKHLLRVAPALLKRDGRLAVISYHSLEDRLVKEAFRADAAPRRSPITHAVTTPSAYQLLTRKPLYPSLLEVRQNPRCRSARLRAIQRVV